MIVKSAKSNSLSAKIKATGYQILERQEAVDSRSAALSKALHHQLTAPASLLLASGIGFIIGELTKRQNPICSSTSGQPLPRRTALKNILGCVNTARALYTVLPLLWLLKNPAPQGAEERQSLRRRGSNGHHKETIK